MQIEMTIKGLMVDPVTNMPIILLRDSEGQKVLPIWVGIYEANAIALQSCWACRAFETSTTKISRESRSCRIP